MSRIVLGQRLDKFTVARAAALAVTAGAAGSLAAPLALKLDPAPAFSKLDPTAEPIPFEFNLPAYDLGTHNKLLGVAVVVVPVGHGEPIEPADWLSSSYAKGSADTSAIQAGGPFTVAVKGVEDGDFTGQVVLTYDA